MEVLAILFIFILDITCSMSLTIFSSFSYFRSFVKLWRKILCSLSPTMMSSPTSLYDWATDDIIDAPSKVLPQDLLDDDSPYLTEECKLFMNSSCSLSPTETLSPSPQFDYLSSSTDPLGLNELFANERKSDSAKNLDQGSRLASESTTSPTEFLPLSVAASNVQTTQTSGKNLPSLQLAVMENGKVTILNESSVSFPSAPSPGHQRSNDGPCMNRNAINARENRLRKKKYTTELETAVANLSKENEVLKAAMSKRDNAVAKLQKEVRYLKSILVHQSQLSGVLTGLLNSSPNLKIRAPLLTNDGELPISSDNVDTTTTTEAKVNTRGSKRKRPVETNIPAKKTMLYTTPTTSIPSRTTKSRPDSHQMDHCYNRSDVTTSSVVSSASLSPEDLAGTGAGGICLHVSSDGVSLEMCANCAESAQLSAEGTEQPCS